MAARKDAPPSDPSTPGFAAQLLKLQDALISGRIDNPTYEKLKADFLAATSAISTHSQADVNSPCSSVEGRDAATKVGCDTNTQTPEGTATTSCEVRTQGDVAQEAKQAAGHSPHSNPVFVPPPLPETVDEVFGLLRHPWGEPTLLPHPLDTAFVSELRFIVGKFVPMMNSYTGYHVEPAIPEKKVTGARAAMCIPHTERIVALYDDTLFGSGKDGIAFGEHAIYWKLGWQAVGDDKGPFRLDYCQIQRLPIFWYTDPDYAFIGNLFKRLSFMTKQNARPIHDMLLEIQQAALRVTGNTAAS